MSATIWIVVKEWENGYHRDSFDSFELLSAHTSEEAADAARDRYRAETCDAYEASDDDEEALAHDFGDDPDEGHWCAHCECGFTVSSVEVADAPAHDAAEAAALTWQAPKEVALASALAWKLFEPCREPEGGQGHRDCAERNDRYRCSCDCHTTDTNDGLADAIAQDREADAMLRREDYNAPDAHLEAAHDERESGE